MSVTPYPETIVIEVDIELQPITPEFLENRKNDCRLIASLLEEGDFGEIRILAHRMKGAGGSFGFDDISEIGEIMEKAALAADKETIGKQILRLADYLQRVDVQYVTILF